MKKITELKTYEITYAPTLKVTQEVVDPYDDWNCENVKGRYFYSPIYNHDREITKTVRVKALTKETAKSMLAVRLYTEIMMLGVRGGVEPYIFDGIRNIKSIEEVKNDD